MSKISIRFWNDREVRAVWDEENSKWWFSAIDIIRAINKSGAPKNSKQCIKNLIKRSVSKYYFYSSKYWSRSRN